MVNASFNKAVLRPPGANRVAVGVNDVRMFGGGTDEHVHETYRAPLGAWRRCQAGASPERLKSMPMEGLAGVSASA